MAKHIVKCPYCNQEFDANIEEFVQIGRRYAHKKCYVGAAGASPYKGKQKKEKKEDPDLTTLKEYIKKLLGDDYNYARVNKQIKDFHDGVDYGYSYSGILKSLVYFYEVKGNPKDKARGGIGIVPFVYKDAYNYYYNLFIAKQTNEIKREDIEYKSREIVIKTPKVKIRQIKLFDIEGDSDE